MYFMIALEDNGVRTTGLCSCWRGKVVVFPELTLVRTSSVDVVPGFGAAVRKLIGGDTDNGTILLVQVMDDPWMGATEEVVGLRETGDLPEEGTRVARQGMEVDAANCYHEEEDQYSPYSSEDGRSHGCGIGIVSRFEENWGEGWWLQEKKGEEEEHEDEKFFDTSGSPNRAAITGAL
jgi:hypothetical protein